MDMIAGLRVSFTEEHDELSGVGSMPKPRSNSGCTSGVVSPICVPGGDRMEGPSPERISDCAGAALTAGTLRVETGSFSDVDILPYFNDGERVLLHPLICDEGRPAGYVSPVSGSVGTLHPLGSYSATSLFSGVSEETSKIACIGEEESRADSPFAYSRETPIPEEGDFIEAAEDVRDYSRWLAERDLPKVVHLDQAPDICRHKVVVRLKTKPYIVHRPGLGLAVKITQFPLLRVKSVPMIDDSDASSFSSED